MPKAHGEDHYEKDRSSSDGAGGHAGVGGASSDFPIVIEVDPAAASLVLGEALALWRGRAYEDFTYGSFLQDEIARLEELRLEAFGLRSIDAYIVCSTAADLHISEVIAQAETAIRTIPANPTPTIVHLRQGRCVRNRWRSALVDPLRPKTAKGQRIAPLPLCSVVFLTG